MQSLLSGLIDRLLSGRPDPARTAFLVRQPFAHRGLHGPGIVENSPAAFAAAVNAGHGIELDVRISADHEAIVFHDSGLERLTGRAGRVADLTAAELRAIPLKGGGGNIPLLDDVLAAVAGRVPVLIEIKAPDRQVGHICLAVRRALEGYRAEAAVMSFNPEVGRWFAEHAARIPRGLVVTEEEDGVGVEKLKSAIARHTALWHSRAEFLAYDIRDLPSRFAAAQRERGTKLLTWTVRTADEEARAMAHADEMIYERAGAAAG